ncbi:MAG: DUF4955 domain-containing protein [Bacteroidales bacterium]
MRLFMHRSCSVVVFLFVSVFFLMAGTKTGRPVSKHWEAFKIQGKSTGILLDYSYAGFMHGETGVPEVKYKCFDVKDFGAVPNDGKSDREALIKALEAAYKHGEGIICFPAGRFDLRPEDAPNEPIYIKSSRIVLQGAGAERGGTELFMEYPNPALDENKMWTSPDLIRFRSFDKKKALTKVTGKAQRGDFSLEVASVKELKPGDWVCLELKNNDTLLIAEELAPYSVQKNWNQILKEGVMVQDYHQIVSVEGNTVTFKEPLMKDVDPKWGWMINSFPRLENVGVENIAFVGNFHDTFKHHRSWLDDGGYKPLVMMNAVNSWVRHCRFTDVSEALSVISSANVSVYDCVIDGNLGHSAIRAQGSSRVFIGKIDDQPSQWHSVGISKPSMGTVIWRVKTKANSCFEAHASQPRATLFDACEGGFMRGRAGGAVGSNPNHLSDLVFWNYKALDESKSNFDFWAKDTPYWRFMPPVIIGFHGNNTTFVEEQTKAIESLGKAVYPESLYEAQLELRLGSLPVWIKELKDK